MPPLNNSQVPVSSGVWLGAPHAFVPQVVSNTPRPPMCLWGICLCNFYVTRVCQCPMSPDVLGMMDFCHFQVVSDTLEVVSDATWKWFKPVWIPQGLGLRGLVQGSIWDHPDL